jgi:hypothetical protein
MNIRHEYVPQDHKHAELTIAQMNQIHSILQDHAGGRK